MRNCKDCKWWVSGPTHGECLRVNTRTPNDLFFLSHTVPTASLFTRREFGCVEFEPKVATAPIVYTAENVRR